MSDKSKDRNWQPWQPIELTQWEMLQEKPESTEELPEICEQDRLLEQAKMLDALKEQARQAGHEQGLSEGRAQGHEQGFREGQQAGLEQGLLESQQQQQVVINQWKALLTDFSHSLEGLDTIIASRLMQLSLTAAHHILGQPAVCDGTALLNQIRDFIQQDPMLSGKPLLRVHPDNIPLLEQQLGEILSLHGWRLIADNKLHPGGCKISSDEGDLDASLATRWHEMCRLAASGEL
ncbi:flagellar assembly protein FliH [Xenorhabdus szentirmaii]|uniref:Flagellar assembly protein FliH n=1 Tax=Xenorhabdus szentirmaii DSM 16338 TaxID=1427518 RepID=W1J3N1_9GAMM|nr:MULTISPECIES: flagellar assembly protein FliH [Xenorhabdus]MBD2792480.1 flagellar assembly protein FliH [Xenorhabdus sp. CUL]MBD2821524.1 flagellar assembly protein FliH [Xenorhabdus sp. 42]MBD2824949.1 flagellar assembly protein FliH [Xenorhabdus sp. 5]PHM31930.1 flagellar assembly protein H [Xenorhabdus szentirmaii DSM 16338]CDL85334.1 Flagellar assembly protein fliH [Xenorhabdus szentirmaii DSM 16338]